MYIIKKVIERKVDVSLLLENDNYFLERINSLPDLYKVCNSNPDKYREICYRLLKQKIFTSLIKNTEDLMYFAKNFDEQLVNFIAIRMLCVEDIFLSVMRTGEDLVKTTQCLPVLENSVIYKMLFRNEKILVHFFNHHLEKTLTLFEKNGLGCLLLENAIKEDSVFMHFDRYCVEEFYDLIYEKGSENGLEKLKETLKVQVCKPIHFDRIIQTRKDFKGLLVKQDFSFQIPTPRDHSWRCAIRVAMLDEKNTRTFEKLFHTLCSDSTSIRLSSYEKFFGRQIKEYYNKLIFSDQYRYFSRQIKEYLCYELDIKETSCRKFKLSEEFFVTNFRIMRDRLFHINPMHKNVLLKSGKELLDMMLTKDIKTVSNEGLLECINFYCVCQIYKTQTQGFCRDPIMSKFMPKTLVRFLLHYKLGLESLGKMFQLCSNGITVDKDQLVELILKNDELSGRFLLSKENFNNCLELLNRVDVKGDIIKDCEEKRQKLIKSNVADEDTKDHVSFLSESKDSMSNFSLSGGKRAGTIFFKFNATACTNNFTGRKGLFEIGKTFLLL